MYYNSNKQQPKYAKIYTRLHTRTRIYVWQAEERIEKTGKKTTKSTAKKDLWCIYILHRDGVSGKKQEKRK